MPSPSLIPDKDLPKMVLNETDEIVYAEIRKNNDSIGTPENNKSEDKESTEKNQDFKSFP